MVSVNRVRHGLLRRLPRSVVVASLLVLGLAACGSEQDTNADPVEINTPVPVNDCAATAHTRILEGWRFSVDENDQGVGGEWYLPDYDDSDWLALQPGRAWENSGIAVLTDYDGFGWYRVQFDLPEWDAVYLVVSGIDDAATVWINGARIGEWELDQSRVAQVDLRAHAAPDGPITVVLRVEDRGVYGGLVDPVRITSQLQSGLSPAQFVAWTADSHPDWPMPGWAAGRPLAWTLTGDINRADEALVSVDGAIAPWADAPVVEAWLYDTENGVLISNSGTAEFSLVGGGLPVPRWEWDGAGVRVRNTLFFDHELETLHWWLAITPEDVPQAFKLLIAVRPFAVNRSANMITTMQVDRDQLWINGDLYMVTSKLPDASGVGVLADVMAGALRGDAAGLETSGCAPLGDGAVLWVYDLPSGEATTIDFAFPAARGDQHVITDIDVSERLEAAVSFWESQTEQMHIDVPDERIRQSLPASVGYLLLANDPDGPHPGSLAHDALWVRDAAYTGLALLQAGHAETVRAYIPAIFAGQTDDGLVPPIQGEAIPWDNDEWDSQGQAIFLVVAYYRYTGDLETLRAWYPHMRLAADYIVQLRAGYDPTNTAAQGLLPPSLSAEDIGPANHHHYWDDFWAVAGLQEAAFAAEVLGETDDANWMRNEAGDLRGAIEASIRAVMGANPAYIPASIEETASSAMARGSVPALWPVRVLSPDDQLLTRAFDYYHQQWIDPYNGAYLHRQAQYWPYGGIELAHAYLRLGRGDVLHQILGWSLSNQTLPGTYAWAEQVDPATGGFSGGDMPHAWAAASWFTLIREMIVAEHGDTLELFSLVPEWWFEDDRVVALTNAPTHFGTLDLRTSGMLQSGEDGWQGQLTLTLTGANPPGGFVWTLPYAPVTIEGPDDVVFADGVLTIPGAGGTVTLTF